VKDFLTRKKACERIVAEFVRIRNARKSSEFSRIRLRKSFTALPYRASVDDALCTQGGAPQRSLLRSALGWFVVPLRDGTETDVGLLEGAWAPLVWAVLNSCCVVFMGVSIILHTRRGNGGNGVCSGRRALLHRLPLRGTERAEAVKNLGQAPSRPLIFQRFRHFGSEPVPFFHSLARVRTWWLRRSSGVGAAYGTA
jgi:hypothetical protein